MATIAEQIELRQDGFLGDPREASIAYLTHKFDLSKEQAAMLYDDQDMQIYQLLFADSTEFRAYEDEIKKIETDFGPGYI